MEPKDERLIKALGVALMATILKAADIISSKGDFTKHAGDYIGDAHDFLDRAIRDQRPK